MYIRTIFVLRVLLYYLPPPRPRALLLPRASALPTCFSSLYRIKFMCKYPVRELTLPPRLAYDTLLIFILDEYIWRHRTKDLQKLARSERDQY